MRRQRFAVTVAVVLIASTLTTAAAFALPKESANKFQPSTGCGCHAALVDQWRNSMHAKAMTDPLYIYKRNKANKATKGALGEFCDSCHGPVAVMSGEYLNFEKASPQSREGVGCSFCHQVTGTKRPIGNTSQTVKADGVMRAQFKDSTSPAHATAYSAFHESAEFCGACHDVMHPANPNFLLEATYTEWKNGPYAAEGIVCQDCHMTPGPGVVKPNPGTAAAGGPQRQHIYQMTFVGGNAGLGDPVLAEERLKAATEMELQVPEIVEPGKPATVTVQITNVGAGHYVPTGLTDFRRMWLEVKAKKPDGTTEVIGQRHFGTILRDAKGNAPVDLWEAVAFKSDDRIPPRKSVSNKYQFTMAGEGVTEIEAALYYRSCSEEVAAEAGVEIPTTTMDSVTKAVYSSEKVRADALRSKGAAAGEEIRVPGWIILVGLAIVAAVAGMLFLRKRATR